MRAFPLPVPSETRRHGGKKRRRLIGLENNDSRGRALDLRYGVYYISAHSYWAINSP